MFSLRQWWKSCKSRDQSNSYYRPGCEQLGTASLAQARRPAPISRPQLEQLEERLVLNFATGTVTAVYDHYGNTSVAVLDKSGNVDWRPQVYLNNSFQQLAADAKFVTITSGLTSDGTAIVYGLTDDGRVYGKVGTSMLDLGRPDNLPIAQISGGIKGRLFVTDSQGAIWAYGNADNQTLWYQLTAPGEALQISAGTKDENGIPQNLLFAVGTDHNVWVDPTADHNLPPDQQGWLQFSSGGNVNGVRGGTDDHWPSVFAIVNDGSVWKGTVYGWEKIFSGAAKDVGVATTYNNGDAALITDTSENLFLVISGSSPKLMSGNCACVGEIAGDAAGDAWAVTSNQFNSAISPDDLFQNNVANAWWPIAETWIQESGSSRIMAANHQFVY